MFGMSVVRIILCVSLLFISRVTVAKDVNAYNFEFVDNAGKVQMLEQYKGKVMMVVNTASQCGLTPQYEEMEALWQKFRKKKFVLIAVPSNDFGGQEPGTNKEIKEFCETNFKITFPLMAKVHVKGDDAHPFYKWADSQVSYFGKPKWNFHKYIIGTDGQMLEWFSSATSPMDPRIIDLIDSQLIQ
jgi:glutathione peroxidase